MDVVSFSNKAHAHAHAHARCYPCLSCPWPMALSPFRAILAARWSPSSPSSDLLCCRLLCLFWPCPAPPFRGSISASANGAIAAARVDVGAVSTEVAPAAAAAAAVRLPSRQRKANKMEPDASLEPSRTTTQETESSSRAGKLDAASKAKLQRKKDALKKKLEVKTCKENWLFSLSTYEQATHPIVLDKLVEDEDNADLSEESTNLGNGIDLLQPLPVNSGSSLVIGIDPDVGGALAVLRTIEGGDGTLAEVFDVPTVQILVNGRKRRRHDARLIIELIQKINAPLGTVAYIEQGTFLPTDGRQGCWASGFGFGVWIGALVASGFKVIPVPSVVWKRSMDLFGKEEGKDYSRQSARLLFPSLSGKLQRKKDHGRAEALLLAAYGKGMKPPLPPD